MDGAFDAMLDQLLSHSVNEVSPTDLQSKDNIILLDTREKKEYTTSHIENSIWIGYDDFRLKRVKNIPKNKPIIVYCSVGFRSEKIAEKLTKAGYKDVSNLYGGIFEWVHQGHKVFTAQELETKKVHTFDKAWSQWLTKGKKIY